MSDIGGSMDNNYESAAKDIEQEKKVVAALKRLSIGHMMLYDPDLPMEDMEYQFHFQQLGDQQNRSPSPTSPRRGSPTSPSSSLRSPQRNSPEKFRDDMVSIALDKETSGETDAPLDTESLIWVPANLHPEVDPEQFKLHIRNKVEEIMDKKMKSKSLSRKSSLSSSYSNEHEQTPDSGQKSSPQTPGSKDTLLVEEIKALHRKSNPSLRDLTSELQRLSKLAGMDSGDAVTIARTLSSTALGYTDVEKQAIDELTSPTSSSRIYNLSDSDTQSELSSEPPSPTLRKHVTKNKKAQTQGSAHNTYDQDTHNKNNPVSLKRSRRLEHKRPQASLSTGSNLQNHKAGKLAELRNSLYHSDATEIPNQMHHSGHRNNYQHRHENKKNDIHDKLSRSHYGDVRTSSYSDSSTNNDSPYPTSSSHMSLNSMKQHKMNRNIGKIRTLSMSNMDEKTTRSRDFHERQTHSQVIPGMNNRDMRRPSSSIPNKPVPPRPLSSTRSSHQRKDSRDISQMPHRRHPYANVISSNMPHSTMPHSKHYRPHDAKVRLGLGPEAKESSIHGEKMLQSEDRSTKINQNLDLLRSEINEFKECLTKIDGPSDAKTKEDQNVEKHDSPDISFDTTQNISYEDVLNIEKTTILDSVEEPDLEEPILEEETAGKQLSDTDLSNKEKLKDDEQNKKVPDSEVETQQKRGEVGVSSLDELDPNEVDQSSLIDELELAGKDISSSESLGEYSSSSVPLTPTKKKPIVLNSGNTDEKSQKLASSSPTKKISKKKSWPWIKDRVSSTGSIPTVSNTENSELSTVHEVSSVNTGRSVSNPETLRNKLNESLPLSSKIPATDNAPPGGGKENVITKFFKKRSGSVSSMFSSHNDDLSKDSKEPVQASGVTLDYESDSDAKRNIHEKIKKGIFKKKKTKGKQNAKGKEKGKEKADKSKEKERSREILHDKGGNGSQVITPQTTRSLYETNASGNTIEKAARIVGVQTRKSSDKHNAAQEGKIEVESTAVHPDPIGKLFETEEPDTSRAPDDQGKDDKQEVQEQRETPEEYSTSNLGESRAVPSTEDVHEKIRRSIKRTSKANQPIEFTDSAFGFPLPPPSQSTLVMLHYRFPVHVERAIYRLSHLKLANPKRCLREQVLLSNFMYAYLNLVDHTLHLERQLNSDSSELDQEGDTKNTPFASTMDYDDEEGSTDEDEDDFPFDNQMTDLDAADPSNISPSVST